MNIITLTTDFGTQDPFAGIMKGVMCTINDRIQFIDISHHIEPQNILQAAYIIQHACSYFPSGTVHAIVVDPGVGTDRRAIIAQTKEYYFVAPDNGVLSPVFSRKDLCRVVEITAKKYFLTDVSSTFHGRDVFAPVSAWLAKGEDIKNFGREINDYKTARIPQPERMDSSTIQGEIIYKDRFGNLITNISEKFTSCQKNVTIKVLDIVIDGIKNTYAESDGRVSALINSWGMVEIFMPGKNAAEELEIEIGEKVWIQQIKKY